MHKTTTAEKSVHLMAAKTCLTCGRDFDADSGHSICPDDQTLLCPTFVDSDIGMTVGSFELVSKRFTESKIKPELQLERQHRSA